jgi:hypothetical protein
LGSVAFWDLFAKKKVALRALTISKIAMVMKIYNERNEEDKSR